MPTLNQLLHAASRTFAVGIDLLPEPLREEVQVAYLLLRVSDYLEDSPALDAGQKVTLLESWAEVLGGTTAVPDFEDALGPVVEESPDALVARNLGRVHAALASLGRAQARELICQHVRDSTLGMARWAARGPDIADEADLDDYMHEVAGRVGWLLTELFALDVPEVVSARTEMLQLGREFGLGLQTVNVIRGLHVDWRRGWVYVPRNFLHGDASEATQIFERTGGGPEETLVLERLVDKAERHLGGAGRYIERLPRHRHGIRLFCLLPYFFALRTLALSRGNAGVFHGEVKIGRADVRSITRATRAMGWSNSWIKWYAGRLSSDLSKMPNRPLKFASD